MYQEFRINAAAFSVIGAMYQTGSRPTVDTGDRVPVDRASPPREHRRACSAATGVVSTSEFACVPSSPVSPATCGLGS